MADVSRIHVPKADVRFLSEDEISSLQYAAESIDASDEFQRDWRDLTFFLLFTGARLSEALFPSFDWSCVGQNAIKFPRTKMFKTRTIPSTESIKEILENRKDIQGGPFRLNKDQAYKRIKWFLGRAGIKNASPHTLRKTAGAWYYMATRDIFAASKFLGHSTVVVTQDHYAGLIQSLQVEYAERFEKVLQGCLQLACNFDTNQHYSAPIGAEKEIHESRRETRGSREWTLQDSNL